MRSYNECRIVQIPMEKTHGTASRVPDGGWRRPALGPRRARRGPAGTLAAVHRDHRVVATASAAAAGIAAARRPHLARHRHRAGHGRIRGPAAVLAAAARLAGVSDRT